MKTKKVAEIMTRAVVALKPDMRLTDAIKVMLKHNVSAVPVVDAQQDLVGIIGIRHHEFCLQRPCGGNHGGGSDDS